MGALFFAVRLHPVQQQRCSRWLSRVFPLRPGLSPVAPEDLHFTVLFLGSLSPAKVGLALSLGSLVASAAQPFPLLPAGLGWFGAALRPRVIWLGAEEGEESLQSLNRDLTRHAAEAGLPHDSKNFVAHCTVARVRRRLDPGEMRCLEVLRHQLAQDPGEPTQAERLELLHSVPATGGGARYRTVADFKFG